MKKQLNQNGLTGHHPHDLVSTMIRFANEADYVEAVRAEYYWRKGKNPNGPPKHHAYSFKNKDDTELVMLYQPDTRFATGSTTAGLTINFEYVDKMGLIDFSDFYDQLVAGNPNLSREEVPGTSFRGDQDKLTTIRAVLKLSSKATTTYRGIITNPPYPAIWGGLNAGLSTWLLPALLGLATGLAVVPLIRTLRNKSEGY